MFIQAYRLMDRQDAYRRSPAALAEANGLVDRMMLEIWRLRVVRRISSPLTEIYFARL